MPTDDATLPKAAEWFLDNYYLIRRVARQVDEDLPRGLLPAPAAARDRAGEGLPAHRRARARPGRRL